MLMETEKNSPNALWSGVPHSSHPCGLAAKYAELILIILMKPSHGSATNFQNSFDMLLQQQYPITSKRVSRQFCVTVPGRFFPVASDLPKRLEQT